MINNTNALESATNTVNANLAYVGEKVDSLFTALSAKIGVASDHFWPIFVKQQQIEGVTILLFVVIGVFLSFVLFKLAKKIGKADILNEDLYIPLYVFSIVFGGISILYLFIDGPDSVGKIINPEYSALKEIGALFKK